MEDYPEKLSALESRFSNEEACRDYLFHLRWPEGFRCPRCNNNAAWTIGKGLYQCKECRYKVSITAGTIFEGTRKPLTLWFRAIWLVISTKNGASASSVQRILGLGSYETAWTWLHKLRRAMIRPDRDRLSGQIEVDETYIGGVKRGKRGRGASGKALVLIAAQIDVNHIGRIRLRRVENASAASLEEAIQQAIEPGSKILTDGWKGYSQLNSLGYVHDIIRRETAIGDNLLPRCNRVASLVKRWIIGTHQGGISHEHLDYYLDEYTFRFNRRTSRYRGKLFFRLLQQAMYTKPAPYNRISKGIRGLKTKNTTYSGNSS